MRTRDVAVFGVLAIVAAACSVADPGVVATESVKAGAGGGGLIPDDPGSTGNSVPTSYDVIDGVIDFGERGPSHPDYDGFLTHAFQDLETFWADEYPAVYGSDWQPLEGGIYAAYPDRGSSIPGCSPEAGTTTEYQDVEYNAFYCGYGDFMAYDDEQLLPELVDELGKEAVGVVLAHEFGHAVQARNGDLDGQYPTVLTEQQADCFAGAWAGRVASNGTSDIFFDDDAINSGIIAMLRVADPVGSGGPLDDSAHGTGFDRVGAFQDGFRGGVARCSTFFTENRLDQLIELDFDPNNPSGNLPLFDPTEQGNDIVTNMPLSLDNYWKDVLDANGFAFTPPTFAPFSAAGPLPSCSTVDDASWVDSVQYCPDDNVVHWDQDYVLAMSENPLTGDMGVGYLFSVAYADAVQHTLGSKAVAEQRALYSDCLTGAWAAAIVPVGTEPIWLSAGDLDEAVVMAIGVADSSSDQNLRGGAFEKIDAFRQGVLGGLGVCSNVTSS